MLEIVSTKRGNGDSQYEARGGEGREGIVRKGQVISRTSMEGREGGVLQSRFYLVGSLLRRY